MTNKMKMATIIATSLLVLIVVFGFVPPIAQDTTYHNFADTRGLLGIPNFGDVISNVTFTVFGLVGLLLVGRNEANLTMKGEQPLWQVFFVGAALVGFGSGYYHLDPNNHTLVWDRLPMTIAFMSLFALMIMERVSEKIGLLLSPILIAIGILSVFYWDYTESLGQGDLRLYALVQFMPLLLIPLILWLFPARYTGMKYIGYTVAWYVLAKLLEHCDVWVFEVLNGVVSGHTLKHLAASMSVYTMFLYVKKKEVVSTT